MPEDAHVLHITKLGGTSRMSWRCRGCQEPHRLADIAVVHVRSSDGATTSLMLCPTCAVEAYERSARTVA